MERLHKNEKLGNVATTVIRVFFSLFFEIPIAKDILERLEGSLTVEQSHLNPA